LSNRKFSNELAEKSQISNDLIDKQTFYRFDDENFSALTQKNKSDGYKAIALSDTRRKIFAD